MPLPRRAIFRAGYKRRPLCADQAGARTRHHKPGEEITIAIEQSIAEGWHTYWSNPGDSGAAPRVKWSLPEGFTEAKIEWPAPHKLPYGPLLNYGYENSVILLQKIKAPETLPEGPVTLKTDGEVVGRGSLLRAGSK